MRRKIFSPWPALILVLLAGCASTPPEPNRLINAATAPTTHLPPVAPRHAGSIFSSDHQLRLYEDRRARQVGDVVTVTIVENATAAKKAKTTSNRTSSAQADLDALWNFKWTSPNSGVSGVNPGTWFKGSLSNKYQGDGETNRQDSMNAAIACRVMEILPAGNLYIKGTRRVQVNYEHQSITLEGIINVTDISPSNVVLSTNVAEARITYAGSGPVSDKQRPGWLSRILDLVWPF